MAKSGIKNYFGRLKLSKKFLLMYVFCVIFPLVITDAILFRFVFDAEISNQSYDRDIAIEGYFNYLENLNSYDSSVASAIDLNKNLNSFINTRYSDPYEFYDALTNTVTYSYFTTLTDLKWDRIVIYSDNRTMLSGNYFHNLSEAQGEVWYRRFINSGRNEAVYAYYDMDPINATADRNRFVYVRRMLNTKSDVEKIITIEHKLSRIQSEIQDIPVNCSMYLCCDDYVIYSNREINVDYQSLVNRSLIEPYKTIKEVEIGGTTFKVYAFSDEVTITTIIGNNWPIVVAILFFTLLIPIVTMKLLERSITERITILGKAFGEGSNDYFQPIKEIKGSDEISDLMHNYNRIVEINNELTNTIYKDKLREQESDLARKNAELLALQSQINPHFLFNALESIRMHSVLKGETETAEMVQKLAVMERQNVEWHDDSVTIEEEEGFIDAYLQLQSYRFGERISFNIDISEDCKKILIPKLTLVTFVENACVHGIESKSAQGWIFVRVYKEEKNLVIEVEDTGDGMEEADVEALQEKINNVTIDMVRAAKHVGILNACLRIKMMFKDQVKFTIESEKGIGMSVIITIPSDLITTA
ncbi:two-component system, sensor histidine kinase YesM [Ruminococcaceae bacterium YAD3003]|nr:two-component system, sensor histidine kinase YesM [Ruminococcaceae bacterium YAD3003]